MPNPAEINVLYNEDFMRDPYPFFQMGLEKTPITRNEETLTKPYYVFRFKDVQNVLKDYQTYSSETDAGTQDMALGDATANIIAMDPPRHSKLRRIAQLGFLPTVINQFAPRAQTLARERVDYALAKGEIDVVEDIAAQITVGMITAILGLPLEDWPVIRQWTVEIANNVMANNWVMGHEPERAEVTARVVREMADYFRDYIKKRKAQPLEGDIISVLLTAESDGYKYTDEEVESTAILLLLAGNDTTSNLISNFVTCMAKYPEQANLVRNDMSLLPRAIDEVMRFTPSLLCQERRVAKPVRLYDVDMEPDSIVIPWIAAANRDPAVFERPNEFDIQRKPTRHLSFGFGPHTCLGAPLARLEGRIAVEEIMKRTRAIELIGEAKRPQNSIINGPAYQQARFIAN